MEHNYLDLQTKGKIVAIGPQKQYSTETESTIKKKQKFMLIRFTLYSCNLLTSLYA